MAQNARDLNQTVAVIDDDEASRDSFEVLLGSEGYHVEAYADGAQFLRACSSINPCCALLEVWLPGLDGLAVLERLRETDDSFPVILMTRVPKLPVARQVHDLGAVMLLEKPIEGGSLISAVRMATSTQLLGRGKL